MKAAWSTWDRRDSGPLDAEHTVLLLPGGMCTAMSYEELMAEPRLAGVHLVAVTLPGHGGTPPPDDLRMENYARLTSELADHLGCDAVVGFSLGANVALEMVGSGGFAGPVVLLAPSFSRADEAVFLRILDRLARVFGRLPYKVMLKMVGQVVKDSPLPADRLEALVGELRKNDPRVMRNTIHAYLRYFDHYGSVASRLGESGVPAWVVHGETGDGGITDAERRTLEAFALVTLITIPGGSFFMPNEEPALIAGFVLDALERASASRDA
jgi:pimeloyl-ACP methyl ester carboxylesterase